MLGSLVTYSEQPKVTIDGENQVVTHQPKDADVKWVNEIASIGPMVVTVTAGTAFRDECMQLNNYRLAGDPVPVRHWLFNAPAVDIKRLTFESEPGLGSDGSGRHLARATFDMTVIETSYSNNPDA